MPWMMKTDPTTPCAWANTLVTMWGPRFPVDVRQIATEYSKRFADPIVKIAAAEMPGFEGALGPLSKKGGWGIVYNPAIRSPGRINYTLGHEFGHYLCHRHQTPLGFQCGQSDVLGATKLQERQADQFSSYLLMPLNDFRTQIGNQRMTLDLLRHCADRYDVSYTAAALKWLESTAHCAAVVVATNGYVLWCRRSTAAMRQGIFFRSGMELPAGSIAADGDRQFVADSGGVNLAPGIWWDRPTREVAIFADHYEMTISLLVFEESGVLPEGWEDEEIEDSYDHFVRSIR